jgi:hypothetical protein
MPAIPIGSGALLRRGQPVQGFTVDDPVKDATVGLDHPPRAKVVLGAGNKDFAEAQLQAHQLGLDQHLGGMATPSIAGHEVIADVAAGALQGRGEAVADDDRAQSALRYERTGVRLREPICGSQPRSSGRWRA